MAQSMSGSLALQPVVRRERKATSIFWLTLGRSEPHFSQGGLLADLEELLGCKVDIVTEEGLHWYIRDRMQNEAVPL